MSNRLMTYAEVQREVQDFIKAECAKVGIDPDVFAMEMFKALCASYEVPETCSKCPHMGPYGHGEPPDCEHPAKGDVGPWEFANPNEAPPVWCPIRMV